MALTVEDGTGLADADSYVSASSFATYAVNIGAALTAGPDETDAALRRATSWLDATYAARFPGFRYRGRLQALAWPRSGALDISGSPIGVDEIPREIERAVCEAALREIAEPGALAPDMERGGAIQSVQAGSVGVTFAAGAPAETTFSAIDNALAPLIGKRVRGLASGPVVRG